MKYVYFVSYSAVKQKSVVVHGNCDIRLNQKITSIRCIREIEARLNNKGCDGCNEHVVNAFHLLRTE